MTQAVTSKWGLTTVADQYSGDMIVDLLHKVDDAKVRPVVKAPSFSVPPFTFDIFPYLNVEGWLPFVLFIEITSRLQGTNCKAMGVRFE